MEIEEKYTIETKNLIALCHVLDDFDDFERNLIAFLPQENINDTCFKLSKASREEKGLFNSKEKKFYKENKKVIDTINQYGTILSFLLVDYYDNYENSVKADFKFFYQYLLDNKEQLPDILKLLEKLDSLGFKTIDFINNGDFTKNTTSVYTNFSDNYHITYFDNAEVLPSYDSSRIDYKTNLSNYRMYLNKTFKDISEYGNKISVNSLLFNQDRLPDKLDRESTFDKLVEQKKKNATEDACIRDSVTLGVGLSDLEEQLFKTGYWISNLKSATNKDELLLVLKSMKGNLEELKRLGREFDESILSNNSSITPDVLNKQKKLYLDRREWARLDID